MYLNIMFKMYHIKLCNNRGTNKFVRFFLEMWGFIVKKRLQCNHSKYCPSPLRLFVEVEVRRQNDMRGALQTLPKLANGVKLP